MLRTARILVAACFVQVLISASPIVADEPRHTENVILVTMDGLRWQELFGGGDESYMTKEGGAAKDPVTLKARFNGPTPEVRREKLMPFFWKHVATKGQVFGDASQGSTAQVTNGHNFSYPGYSEILCGFADPRVDSNDKKNNPNVTVLEWLSRKPAFQNQVAAFASWDVFPWIINTERSGIPVNAGWQPASAAGTQPHSQLLHEVGEQLPRLWDNVRYDALTMQAVFDSLKTRQPRVLFVSLGETDDFAHEGRYDHYLDSAHRNDRLIEKLWNHIQTLPQYHGKTSLIITTDHGRGDDRIEWKNHGKNQPMSKFMWIAVLGPDTPALGIRKETTVTQSQIAATVAQLLGEDYAGNVSQAGKPLPGAIRSND